MGFHLTINIYQGHHLYLQIHGILFNISSLHFTAERPSKGQALFEMGSVIVPTLLLILTVLALFHTYQTLRWSATGIREKGSTLRSSTVAPAIQIFTVIDHSQGLSWERFFQNHLGWHKEFRNVRAYSYKAASCARAKTAPT